MSFDKENSPLSRGAGGVLNREVLGVKWLVASCKVCEIPPAPFRKGGVICAGL